jgi:hypothetical protein
VRALHLAILSNYNNWNVGARNESLFSSCRHLLLPSVLMDYVKEVEVFKDNIEDMKE